MAAAAPYDLEDMTMREIIEDRLDELVPYIVQRDLLSRGSLLRHDSTRLAKLVVSLKREERNPKDLTSEPIAVPSMDGA